jgi:hypothetical protein
MAEESAQPFLPYYDPKLIIGLKTYLFQIISADFAASMISAGFGKLYVIKPVFSIDCG